MSRGHSQPRSQFGRTLDRCSGKTQSENVVIIDVEEDDSHSATSDVRKDNKLQPSSVISIDDDDDDEEEEEEDHVNPGNDDEACHNRDSHATSSKAYYPASSKSRSSEDSDDDEYLFIGEKMSKSKLTYYRKRFSKYHFGLNADSDESSSSESDFSDCEIMVGSHGNIREQWEKAALSRKICADVCSGQTGSQDQVNASGSNSDTQKDSEEEYTAEHYAQEQTCFTSSNLNKEKDDIFTSKATGDNVTEDPFFGPDRCNPITDSAQAAGMGGSSRCKIPSSNKSQFSHREAVKNRGKSFPEQTSFHATEFESESGVNCSGVSLGVREQVSRTRSGSISDSQIQFNDGKHCFQEKEENIPTESCSCHTNRRKNTCTQLPNDTKYRRETFEKQPFSEACLFNTQSYDETDINNSVNCSGQKDLPIFSHTNRSWDETKVNCERASDLDKDKPMHGEEAIISTQQDGQIKHGQNYSRDEEEPVLENLCISQLLDENNSLMLAQDRDCIDHVQKDLVGEREKFKETDEYKHAAEGEWASRQEQLRIQSEEANRLRKRKKAETLRLLDVERRQKQRVEEMREMKKKDEESINLKEQVRIDVRNELDKLEKQYTDMASLLRRLGIHVGGGMRPMPHEVHAAYKKALLRFHPDRASRTDLRQQVEAEEKFKLISRSKEKLLLTS